MPRFYYPESMTVGATAVLTDHAAHHVQVLRLAHGETITLFNGEGGEYTATLTAIEKKRVQAEIKAFSPRQNELPYAITLAQALPANTQTQTMLENTKMDLIIEKAVEQNKTNNQPQTTQHNKEQQTKKRTAKGM